MHSLRARSSGQQSKDISGHTAPRVSEVQRTVVGPVEEGITMGIIREEVVQQSIELLNGFKE